jgi:hypothetical protein
VVDRLGKAVEEALEALGVGGVERRGPQCAELAPGMLETLGIAAGDDDLGAFGARQPGRLESDAGAAADDHDGLAEQPGARWARATVVSVLMGLLRRPSIAMPPPRAGAP